MGELFVQEPAVAGEKLTKDQPAAENRKKTLKTLLQIFFP